MNRDDIIRTAEECGIPEFENNESQADNILRFAALVAAAEREACCGGEVLNAAGINGNDYPHQVVEKYRAAIRARGQS